MFGLGFNFLGTPPEEFQMDSPQLEETTLTSIQNEMGELEKQFRSIVRSAFSAITAQNISVDVFIAGLANLSVEHKALHKDFLEKLCSDISKELTLGKVWFKLATYWNFLNYFLLEQVVCEFGDQNLQYSMEDYKSKLKVFRCNTSLHDFAKYSTKISADLTLEKFSLLAITGNLRLDQVDMNMQLLYLPCFSLYIHDIPYQPQHFTTAIAN